MRRVFVLLMIVGLVGGVFSTAAAASRTEFPDFLPFDPLQGELPEGVAVDKVGNVYASFPVLGEIRKYTPDGEESVLVTFDTPGALGLAVDAPGNVYVARGAPYRGVYKVDQMGDATLVPGTDAIISSNALAFDKRGNLYITETWSVDAPLAEYPGCDVGFGPFFGPGGIWRVPRDGVAELWLRDDLLTGLCATGGAIPFPIGANGIAYRMGALFVNNTEKGAVVRIPVEVRGDPGVPEVVAVVPDLDPTPPTGPPFLDGMALDVHGNIYVPVINQSRIVKIAPDGSTVETLATVSDGLDFPASLAFGTGKGQRQSLFVTNYAIGPPGAGPGLLKIDVGVPGLPLP
jgi:sugar lactone lactonase YvrE